MKQIIGLRLESTKSNNKKMRFYYLKLERLSMFRISAGRLFHMVADFVSWCMLYRYKGYKMHS